MNRTRKGKEEAALARLLAADAALVEQLQANEKLARLLRADVRQLKALEESQPHRGRC